MMEREWRGILNRYGQQVILYRGEEEVPLRALLQPVLEEHNDQQLPTPLGMSRQERLLYLGPPDQMLDLDTLVECGGQQYRVSNAHRVGRGVCPYWWAVLYPRDEVEA